MPITSPQAAASAAPRVMAALPPPPQSTVRHITGRPALPHPEYHSHDHPFPFGPQLPTQYAAAASSVSGTASRVASPASHFTGGRSRSDKSKTRSLKAPKGERSRAERQLSVRKRPSRGVVDGIQIPSKRVATTLSQMSHIIHMHSEVCAVCLDGVSLHDEEEPRWSCYKAQCRGTLCSSCAERSTRCPYGCDSTLRQHEMSSRMVCKLIGVSREDCFLRCPHADCSFVARVSWTTTKQDDDSLVASPCSLTTAKDELYSHTKICRHQPAMGVPSLLCKDFLSMERVTVKDQVLHLSTCTKCLLQCSDFMLDTYDCHDEKIGIWDPEVFVEE